MPFLLIWNPDGENKYGHAALRTRKYHMSFWPRQNIEGLAKLQAASFVGVPADLILHVERDKYLEDYREPSTHIITRVTNEDLDRVFEDFLRFNGIEPEQVAKKTAEVAEVIENGMKEQNIKRANMIQMGGEGVDLQLANVKYSFLPTLMKKKNPSGLWSSIFHPTGNSSLAEQTQSCTSFCYHLIELADGRPTMTPIPSSQYPYIRKIASFILSTFASSPILDVNTLEHMAKEHYV